MIIVNGKVEPLNRFTHEWSMEDISIFLNDSEIHFSVDELRPYVNEVRSLANTLLDMCQDVEIGGNVGV